MGLANFYRRFIWRFSDLAGPLTRLLKKENLARKFHWDEKAQKAFDYLRKAFTTAPILRHFDPERPTVLEADASDFALGAIVSQIAPDDGKLHPVAFYSRTFGPAELNYEIYDKKLIAIIRCFEKWHAELEGSPHVIEVLSDHKNLEYFMFTKLLSS